MGLDGVNHDSDGSSRRTWASEREGGSVRRERAGSCSKRCRVLFKTKLLHLEKDVEVVVVVGVVSFRIELRLLVI